MDEYLAINFGRAMGERLKARYQSVIDALGLGAAQEVAQSAVAPEEPSITVRKSRQEAPKTQEPEPKATAKLGKITSYNWQGDPYTDSNSRKWIGSWGKISEIGMAVSPDVEKQFRAAGIKPKDRVAIVLSDGTEMERIWDNRTMQDAQAIRKFGKPLTGRFDLHHPFGNKPHEKDGVAVVGFKKIAAL